METNRVSNRTVIVMFTLILLAILCGAILVYLSRPETVEITIYPPQPTATRQPTATPEPITVYVTGAVAKPQSTVILPYDSRVQDAIDQAGGFTDEANLDAVNVAALVRDGDQIHVPTMANTDTVTHLPSLPTPSGGDLVYINSATRDELVALPGVGVATAQLIIEYRTEVGPFTSLEDLDAVPGIGPRLLEDVAGLISFE